MTVGEFCRSKTQPEELCVIRQDGWIKATAFRLVMDDAAAKGIELYIVVSANAYELAAGEACFDVIGGKYVRFGSYDEYREFVLKTRKEKDKRYKGR